MIDESRVGTVAADAVLAGLPDQLPRIGVATGATPLPLYAELARRVESGIIDVSSATLVALDEYIGLGQRDPRSYATYLGDVIARPLRIDATHVLVSDGLAADPDLEAEACERTIVTLGGIDVQIAGLGAKRAPGIQRAWRPS